MIKRGSTWSCAGTAFFIDPNHVVTCCHVISKEYDWDPNGFNRQDGSVDPNKLNLKWQVFPEIAIEIEDGKGILVECISPPTPSDPFPAIFDFAILELKGKPIKRITCIRFCPDSASFVVGEDVYFSGFPLGAPAMLTHKGMLSGFIQGQDILCIQASINKGNSGGALLNGQGEVIGIMSFRLGGIGRGLEQVRAQIAKAGSRVRIGGVDTLETDKAIIDVLDRTISTGVGYARSVSHVRDYAQKHGLVE
ncbi:MAG: trypsin-like peptidase domain-containing protein [Sedimentisphaerales bacterium]|nr:trypsin-like peptidase domain-containing protein [Sedimentisphaerales bacterium]